MLKGKYNSILQTYNKQNQEVFVTILTKFVRKQNIQNIFRNLIQNQKHIRKVFFRSNIFEIGIKIQTNLTFMYTYTSRKIGFIGKNLNP